MISTHQRMWHFFISRQAGIHKQEPNLSVLSYAFLIKEVSFFLVGLFNVFGVVLQAKLG